MVSLNDLQAMQAYFNSGVTRPYTYRKQQLQTLKKAVLSYEHEIYGALHADLKKSPEESWVTESGFVISEINHALGELKNWMRHEPVGTNLVNFPSSSYVMREPLGLVLVIAPWNYPFMLLLTPLIGAIAAGNCIVLKASEHAPATSALIKKMITENFDNRYIAVAEGDGATVIPQMMNGFAFDHVFFTGSIPVGRKVYEMAASKLVPVTLELGGKSPCVVEPDANIEVAANRIVMAKFSNAGQMCVAPDYLLVHESVKNKLINAIARKLNIFFGEDAQGSYNYGKIINETQFNRLIKYLQDGKIIYGGKHNREACYIQPTLMDQVSAESPIMQEEIFGPILPIISFNNKLEAKAIIDKNKNPLAFYLFTASGKNEEWWLQQVAFGGGCINNSAWHLTNHHLPFGGRGFSGTGKYHGKYSFETFSHSKAVMKTPTWFDPSLKYPPFKGKLKLFKWIIR